MLLFSTLRSEFNLKSRVITVSTEREMTTARTHSDFYRCSLSFKYSFIHPRRSPCALITKSFNLA